MGALAHPVVPAETPPWPQPTKGLAGLATSHHLVTCPQVHLAPSSNLRTIDGVNFKKVGSGEEGEG